jgi:hypothetical protein
MNNAAMQVVTLALLAAHVVVLIALFANRSPVPLFLLNLCMAVGVLIYLGMNLHYFAAPIDWPVIILGAAEAVVAVIAILGLRGVGVAKMPSYAIFSLHILIASAATAFAFLFKIVRLF